MKGQINEVSDMKDVTLDLNEFITLIGQPNLRSNDFRRRYPQVDVERVNERMFTVNLFTALTQFRAIELTPKDQLIIKQIEKTALESELLATKIKTDEGFLVDPTKAIELIQRNFSQIKDRILNLKIVLIQGCADKSIQELKIIFDKEVDKTLRLLASENQIKVELDKGKLIDEKNRKKSRAKRK